MYVNLDINHMLFNYLQLVIMTYDRLVLQLLIE